MLVVVVMIVVLRLVLGFVRAVLGEGDQELRDRVGTGW